MTAILALLLATVTGNPPPTVYNCTGNTVFAIPFPYLAASHVVATQTTAGVASTVTGTVKPALAPTSGTLTLGTACPNGSTLTISRVVPLTQPQSFRTGSYKGADHEQALDRLEMQVQGTVAAQATKDAAQDLATTNINGAVAALNTGSHAVGDTTSILAFGSTTARTLTSRFSDLANVKDYGATGNGSTDDSAAIQATVNALPTTGGTIYFPRGRYLIRTSITSTKSNIRWLCEGVGTWGADSSATELFTDAAIIILDLGSASATVHGGHIIENCTFRDTAGIALGAIKARRMNHVRVVNAGVRDFTAGYGVQFDGTGDATILPLIEGPRFRNNKIGIQSVVGPTIGLTVLGGYLALPSGTGMSGSIGIDLQVGERLAVYNTGIDNYENGIKIQGDSSYIQARFEQGVGVLHNAFVWIASGTSNTVVGSQFSRGTNGIKVDTGGQVNLGPNTWLNLPTTSINMVGSNLTHIINEPTLFDFRNAGGPATNAPREWEMMQASGGADRHAQFAAKAGAGSVVGVLRASVDATSANIVTVGSTTVANVNLMRNNVVLANLQSDGFHFGASGGTGITSFISSGLTTLDFPSTAAGASSDLTITLTGAATGNPVILGIPASVMTAVGTGDQGFFAWVSATNTVTVRYRNGTAGAIDPPSSASWTVSILK